MATTKYIGLWLDSNGDEPKWIVSRDTDEGGRIVDTRTVTAFDEDDYADALALAKDECQRTGYPVCELSADGTRETVYEIDRATTA